MSAEYVCLICEKCKTRNYLNSHIFSLQSRQTDGSEFPVQRYFLGQCDQGQIVFLGVFVTLITSHEERES